MKAQAAWFGIEWNSEWSHAFGLAAAAAAVLILAQVINPVFLGASIIALGCIAYAYFRPLTGFLCYLVWIQIIDYFKRLELVFGDPSSVEWYGILVLPDLILFAVVVGMLAARNKSLIHHSRKFIATAWALGLYAAWYTVRSVVTAAPMATAVGKWKLVVPYFICFYVGEQLLADLPSLRAVFKVLAVTIGLASLYALWQAFFGLSGFERQWLFGGRTSLAPETLLYGEGLGITRAFSFYSDADTFGSLLACAGTILLFSRRAFGRQWWNSWTLLVLMGCALLATLVRGAWLHAFLGAVALSWTQWKVGSARKVVALVCVVAILAGAAVWVLSTVPVLNNPVLARVFLLGTYNVRIIGYQNLLGMGIWRFFAGQGVATMPGSVKDIAGTADPDDFIAHDYVSESLYELGWVGFGLFLFAFIRILTGASPAFLGPLGPALQFTIWSVLMVATLFGGGLLTVRPVTTLVWAFAGVLCASGSKGENESPTA